MLVRTSPNKQNGNEGGDKERRGQGASDYFDSSTKIIVIKESDTGCAVLAADVRQASQDPLAISLKNIDNFVWFHNKQQLKKQINQ